ncbi:MAG: bile acid:sodium symporter family protein [Flavobacteriales bacterium]|nr:bile acid:sodium symporter family protein [Flavobacteriales bacterium]
MQDSLLTQVFLPLALFIIMLGMGLTLVTEDFKRVVRFPAAVALGLFLKLLAIPLVTYLLLRMWPMSPELAVGFILLAACPGGATTNLITHLARADVALSITITAIASVITVFTIPLMVNWGLVQFMGEAREIELPILRTIGQILVVTIIPVAIGMVVRAQRPQLALRAERPVKTLSAIFLVLIILAAMLKERENLAGLFRQAGPLALVMNLLGMAMGYGVTRMVTGDVRKAVTVGVEVGVVNGTLGITIAAGILQNSAMTIPSAIYSLIMFPSVMLLVWVGIRHHKASQSDAH